MAAAWYISAIILLWYLAKEGRYEKPKWSRAIVSALFWPLSIFFKRYPEDHADRSHESH